MISEKVLSLGELLNYDSPGLYITVDIIRVIALFKYQFCKYIYGIIRNCIYMCIYGIGGDGDERSCEVAIN